MYIIGQGSAPSSQCIVSYQYDGFNQMIKSGTGGKTVECAYNGDGLRGVKRVDAQVTRYLYEGDKVVLETDGAGNQTARNVQGLNLLSRTMGSQTVYYMYNGHADVTALLGTSGETLASYYYDAFGNQTETNGNISNPYRYSGEQLDSETGLYYMKSRYYDASIARFISEDTYRGQPNDPLSLNLYTYCNNEPIMYYDPDGHSSMKVGESSDRVKAMQEMLVSLNYDLGEYGADGSFGTNTQAAVQKFQRDYGLEDDGVVGNQTITVMQAANSTQGMPSNLSDKKNYAVEQAKRAQVGEIKDNYLLMSQGEFNKTLAETEQLQAMSQGGQVITAVENNTLENVAVVIPAVETQKPSQNIQGNGNPQPPLQEPGVVIYDPADQIQTLLDLLGLVPGPGEAADFINSGIYALRGDGTNAGLSLGACVPFAGWAATAGKFANKADNVVDASKLVVKNSDELVQGAGKTGPKPAGTGPHNQKIADVANSVKDGKVVAGGQQLPEKAINTAGGIKDSRRPDIIVERPDGSQYGINVGKTTKSGAPIKREADAINDLEGVGFEMHFVPYTK